MGRRADLWTEGMREADGSSTVTALLEIPGKERRAVWYRVPAANAHCITRSADPFVLGVLFLVMKEKTDLHVHGEVSPSLLASLEEFQAAWTSWLPAKYARCMIMADREREQQKAPAEKSVIAFSGGVDSCFSAWRHRTRRCGRLARPIGAGAMIHGFDIPLEEEGVFATALEKAGRILGSLDIGLVPVATNAGRELRKYWGDAHGAAIASCLMLLQSGYSEGIIASTEPYRSLVLPWGSNPVTDGLLSSHAFRILHDGASFTRSEKIRSMAHWPEMLQNLRVCWEGGQKDRNCGCCEKCVRTILNFRISGTALPECFEEDADDNRIRGLRGLNPVQLAYLDEILAAARAASISGSWVHALDECIRKNRRAAGRDHGLLHRIRKTLALRRRMNTLKNALRSA